MRLTVYVVFFFIIMGCDTQDPFYSDYAEEDLYRVPLIPPYKLTNLAVSYDHIPEFYAWELNFLYGGDSTVYGFSKKSFPGILPRVHATDINVTNGIIYGYNQKGEFGMPIGFVIIPEKKIEKVFKNDEAGWKNYLEQHGVKEIKLFPIWPVFKEFKKTFILPWHNLQEKKS